MLDKPKNENYVATVIEVKAIIPLPNCDNVVAVPVFGYQGIVSKDVKIGDLFLMFPPETRLSEAFVSQNNLYRHNDLNKDKDQKGYMEDNRRVRAVRFRGHVSNCLLMPLSSVSFASDKWVQLGIGDSFDVINSIDICEKYVLPIKERGVREQTLKKSRVDQKHMPEHISTANFFKFADNIQPQDEIIVTQKLHGTSIRIGHTYVNRKLTVLEKIVQFFGAKVLRTSFDYIFGSRKVIKDANNPDQLHYYDTDVWTDNGKKLEGLLPKNYLVYAELIGWTGQKEIQKNYSYCIPEGQAEMYIYRIAIVNEDGFVTDLSWNQVKEFCKNNGLKHVPQLWTGMKEDFVEGISRIPLVQRFMDTRYADELHGGYGNALPLKEGLVDEGICIRVDGLIPQIYKAKSPKFLEHETSLLDKGEEDLESSQS